MQWEKHEVWIAADQSVSEIADTVGHEVRHLAAYGTDDATADLYGADLARRMARAGLISAA